MSVMHRIEVGVLVSRRALTGPWGGVAWRPEAVLLEPPPIPPGTKLRADESGELFYAGLATISLYPGETPHYRDNFTSERPSVWIAFRPEQDGFGEVVCVTVDPYEGESLADSIEDAVEPVPMPDAIREWVEAFFAAHHVEREFFKRKRDRANPDAFGRRGPPGKREGER